MSGSSGTTRRTFKQQVHVNGQYGSRTIRRKDDPDVGIGKVHAVLTFDGVVDYNSDPHFGNISVDEDTLDTVRDDLQERVSEIEVITLVEGDDDE